jgi:FkbM family methyltransferase
MRIQVEVAGEERELECFDNELSPLISAVILRGVTYPVLDIVREVSVVVDIGANIGASALWFSLMYPDAMVHALEPGSEAFRLLTRNTAGRPNVRRYPFGLFSKDAEVTLYAGADDSVQATIGKSAQAGAPDEMVRLRSIAAWLDEVGIDVIDVLKVDTEGCELPILRGIKDRLPAIRLIHVEYHSESDRREIDRLLEPTHALADGRVLHLHRGELTYVAHSAFDSEAEYRREEIVVDL